MENQWARSLWSPIVVMFVVIGMMKAIFSN
jgi:hypothetical protein